MNWHDIALVRIGEQVFATDANCPHGQATHAVRLERGRVLVWLAPAA